MPKTIKKDYGSMTVDAPLTPELKIPTETSTEESSEEE